MELLNIEQFKKEQQKIEKSEKEKTNKEFNLTKCLNEMDRKRAYWGDNNLKFLPNNKNHKHRENYEI